MTFALERTHLAKHDLDWLPPGYRAVRWGVAGAVWTGIFGAVGTLMALTKFQAIFFGKGLAALAAGGYFAGDRAARAVLRSRLRKLAEGAVDLSRLPAEPDGELVHVEGRVHALQSIPTLTGEAGQPVVFRRAAFTVGETRVVHEAAVDFWLVADNSEPVLVEVELARLLVSDARGQWYAGDHPVTRELESLPLPPELDRAMTKRTQLRTRGKKVQRVRLSEVCLREGDVVEVLGYKSRTVDPTVSSRLPRETPYRATLRGGRALPLLIAPRT